MIERMKRLDRKLMYFGCLQRYDGVPERNA